ncbi:amsh-like protease [Holotrichia oblita]|uniref:Amsh-like protease n=1 Tax=Holotrichia oblita TaxID=644536 RepID=A0ACB9T0E7_HOLOL|nr:amsh-like protease [Holotrichia oblita]
MFSRRGSPMEVLDPQERLRILTNYSNAVEVDPNVPPKRYYRSGVEMVRMANTYLNEGSLENAYVLYMKYMTLFIEKIRKHPDFASVPSGLKAANTNQLREILPKTEKLKSQLLEQYKHEYNAFLEEKKRREKLQAEHNRKQKVDDDKMRELKQDVASTTDSWLDAPIIPITTNLESIKYPDDDTTASVSNRIRSSPTVNSYPNIHSAPSIDRSNKPSSILSSTIRAGLRPVRIPGKVMATFLLLAQRNTMSNIETCGILAGTLERHSLIISHMILPKQKGTADSCMTMNEEEIFDYQDQHNLITIGWIHTHPTQTAFLSSVDLHTHCPYQLLMPEAIAVVCAPKYNETGFFILTPDYGVDFIANCKHTGFHPHPTDPPLFMNADHVKIDLTAPLEVLDLR